MKIFIVGSGKLANALCSSLSFPSCELLKWDTHYQTVTERSIVIHTGSGRQLTECIEFCKRTGSVFIELSTGLETEHLNSDFTLIVCPNTSILVLKTMHMLKLYGQYFKDYKISMTESHQSTKTSEPGTAFSLAESLSFPTIEITSVRDKEIQLNSIGIPSAYLDKHAYHKIVIEDSLDQITIETKVLGHDSYTQGVKKIVDAVLLHPFEKRRYSIIDLIDLNWL